MGRFDFLSALLSVALINSFLNVSAALAQEASGPKEGSSEMSIQVPAVKENPTELKTEPSTSAQPETANNPNTAPTVKNYANRDLIGSTKKPYKFSFFSLASARVPDMEKGGQSIGAYNYLGISYKLTSDSQVGFRYVFYYDTAGYKFNPAKFREEYVGHRTEVGDPYLSYSQYSLIKTDNWNVSGSGRIYLPASRFSQATKMVTQLRTEIFVDRPVGKYSNFNYTVKADYFVQTQKAFLDEEVPRREDGTVPRNAVKTTKQGALEHYIEYDANLHKTFSIKPRIGFEENWYYGSDEENLDPRHDTDAKSQLGFEYRVNRSMNFTLAMENKTALTNRKDEVALFRPEDNKWIFITYASF